ncbi:hypothetical protein BJ170DRAFT_690464 [Xylariales sp. AK1849]|nr:hypothetical protein BJ170DRAFT_690464 [Xylariales sp. AK1849]
MEGYARISKLMGGQDEYAIFRRFRDLNTRNLLYLQAELTHLEKELEGIATRDSLHPDRVYFSKDWWSLSQSEDEDSEQWEKVLEIRETLDEYNNALLKQAKIARLGTPSPYDLKFLQQWLVRPSMGNFPRLGLDRYSYSAENEHDLVAVKARSVPDIFSRWLKFFLIPKWHKVIGEKFKLRSFLPQFSEHQLRVLIRTL